MNQLLKLCAFADEADPKLDAQINMMLANGIPYLEMRGVDGKNVADLSEDEVKAAVAKLDAAGLKVWSLGSPAGKTKITDDFAFEEERFARLLRTADLTGAKCIRLFSFYGTDGSDEYFDEVCKRLSRFIEMAKEHDVVLCHENEKGIYGDTAERCEKLLKALPDLKAVYDPANFLQCGEDTLAAWDTLAPYIHYMHIKDCAEGGNIVPPGEGVGQLPALLARYAQAGGGVVTLEPHLTEFVGLSDLEEEGDKSAVGGCKFASGREAFDYATNSIKNIIANLA
jgi:sugar phosphate isomerase/epimerase